MTQKKTFEVGGCSRFWAFGSSGTVSYTKGPVWLSVISDTEPSLCRACLSCSASKLLRLKPIWYALLLEEVGWTERGREGGYHWLLKWLPLHFCKKHDFLFSFCRVWNVLHIRLLHNILYPHSIDLPASVFQTPVFDIYYELLLCYHPTHCLRRLLCQVLQCSCWKSVISPCSISSLVCLVINTTTEELHAQYYMSLWKPGMSSDGHQNRLFGSFQDKRQEFATLLKISLIETFQHNAQTDLVSAVTETLKFKPWAFTATCSGLSEYGSRCSFVMDLFIIQTSSVPYNLCFVGSPKEMRLQCYIADILCHA